MSLFLQTPTIELTRELNGQSANRVRRPREVFFDHTARLLPGRFESLFERLPKRALWFLSVPLSMIQVAVGLYPNLRGGREYCDRSDKHGHFNAGRVSLYRHLFYLYIAGASIFFALRLLYIHLLPPTDPSPIVQLAGWCVRMSWMFCVAFGLQRAIQWCEGDTVGEVCARVAQLIGTICYVRVTFLFTLAVQKRVQLTEGSFGEDLRSQSIRFFRRITACVGVVCFVALLAQIGSTMAQASWRRMMHTVASNVFAVYHLMSSISYSLVCFLVVKALTQVRHSLEKPVGQKGSYVQAEAAWAHRTLGRFCWATAGPCAVQGVCTALQCIAYARMGLHITDGDGDELRHWSPLALSIPIVQCLGETMDMACLLLFVGVFRIHVPSLHLGEQNLGNSCDGEPMMLRKSITQSPQAKSLAWQRKVEALAQRSVKVGSLLQLHASLSSGSMMPHFDPRRSTTTDVVRQAIIPLSRTADGGGAAYASLTGWDQVVPSDKDLPSRMVTHTWSNVFTHLVAAVIADALERDEYEGIAQQLARKGHHDIEAELVARDELHRGYWICAFCVNQHASICHGFPRRPPDGSPDYDDWDASCRDSVTGEIYPCCSCTQKKLLNDSPGDCEMNKFDDMMAYLHKRVPEFRQVVAVDQAFTLFTRAWCVAELVQAQLSGIPQGIVLLSARSLELSELHMGDLTVYRKLATLTVKDCKASRAEDKKAILEKIPDIALFDAQLQNIIFGDRGLLRQKLEGFGAWEAAVRVAYRVKCLQLPDRGDDLWGSVTSNDWPEHWPGTLILRNHSMP